MDAQICSVFKGKGMVLPLNGTCIGTHLCQPVKNELDDDPEILKFVAKLKEAEQKLATELSAQQAAEQIRCSQTTTSFELVSNSQINGVISNDNRCCERSIKGQFGWEQLGNVFIPYIFRHSEKYCSVRMIESKVIKKYLNCLHPDIYSNCTCVRSYYITDAEARLLIEINKEHCDSEFDDDIYTEKDLVVRLSDATNIYQFLCTCYNKLVASTKTLLKTPLEVLSEKCGFIRINQESVVPYVIRNNMKVVPIFYFEGETENLSTKAQLLNGLDLDYLKFCCIVQGIRKELYSVEKLAVVPLTDIKSHFPDGTEFEDFWPNKIDDCDLIIHNQGNLNKPVKWYQEPLASPPNISSGSSNCISGNSGNSASSTGNSGVSASQKNQHSSVTTVLMKQRATATAAAAAAVLNSQAAMAAAASTAMLQQSQGNNRMIPQATVQSLTNSGWMSGAQTNYQLRAQMMVQQSHANAAAAGNRIGSYREHMNNLMMSNSDRQGYSSYNNPAISMSSVNSHGGGGGGNAPPPLVRSAAGQNANHMSLAASAVYLQQQQQVAAAQQQQAAAVAQQQRLAAAVHHAQQNGRSGSGGGSGGGGGGGSSTGSGSGGSGGGTGGGTSSSSSSAAGANSASMHLQRHAALVHAAAANAAESAQRLCVIPEIPTSNMTLHPYKVQKVCVDKHLVPCINMKAYNDSEQLMTLTEFQKNFFPTVPLDHCKRLIEALGVELYKANRRQVQILMEYDRSYNENMPLVQVRDIIKYMTQLTFMTRHPEQPPAKRTRTS